MLIRRTYQEYIYVVKFKRMFYENCVCITVLCIQSTMKILLLARNYSKLEPILVFIYIVFPPTQSNFFPE